MQIEMGVVEIYDDFITEEQAKLIIADFAGEGIDFTGDKFQAWHGTSPLGDSR